MGAAERTPEPCGPEKGAPYHRRSWRGGRATSKRTWANVFDRLYNGEVASAVQGGCWAHARRKFVALRDTDFRVAFPIKLIGRLHRIERRAAVPSFQSG